VRSIEIAGTTVAGYELALRPKRLLGRFRSPASEIDEILAELFEGIAKLVAFRVLGELIHVH
jgi:hypothetical protein